MKQDLITMSLDPKAILETLVYRVHLDQMDDQERAALWETRVQMEEEVHLVTRGHLDNPEDKEIQDSQDLLVLRAPEGSEVNLDPEESKVYPVLREDRDHLEVQDQLDAEEETDRRVNQVIQVIKVFVDLGGPEEYRVRTVQTGMDLKD